MGTYLLVGNAKKYSASPLMLLLSVSPSGGTLQWIWITVTQDVSHANTGTWHRDTAILWVSRIEFVTAMSMFSNTPNTRVRLSYDEGVEVNNVRLLEYAQTQLEFSRTALGSRTRTRPRGAGALLQQPAT